MKKEAPDGASFFHLNQRHALAKHVEYLCFELPGVDRLGHVAVDQLESTFCSSDAKAKAVTAMIGTSADCLRISAVAS